MNLDELQAARDRERQTDKLQQLRASFYADAGEFIQQLHAERERAAERADDPFDSPEVSQLTDEIQTAEQTVEAIYEKRVGKLVKAASFAAADLPAEVDGMTDEEEALFDTLVADIKQNREHVLAVLSGENDPDDERPPATEATPGGDAPPAVVASARDQSDPVDETSAEVGNGPPQSGRDEPRSGVDESGAGGGEQPAGSPQPSDFTAAAMGGDETPDADPQVKNDGGTQPSASLQQGQQPDGHTQPASTAGNRAGGSEETGTAATSAQEGSDGRQVERETVRITSDVNTFVGYDDREYDLAENDIVQLPATNAGPLLERGVAEKMDF
ncbi:MAG: hypothetical protein V5A55_05310 [Halovenus sp.]